MSSSARLLVLAMCLAGCGESAPPAPVDPAVVEARRLLADAGFPEGKGFPALEVLYNDAEWHKRIAAAIQEMWRKNLGITVSLRAEEWRVFLQNRQAARYQIARGGYTGEYRDPHAFLKLFMSDSAHNSTKWSSAEYDRLVLKADEEPDPAKRFAMLAQAERILLDEGATFPVFHYVGHNWLKPFVKGVQPNYRDMHPMQHVWLEGDGAPKDGVLVYWAGEEPSSLDPGLSTDMRGLKTAMNLFEGLVNYDPRDASPAPGVAHRWEASEDGLTWTFRLRPSSWSNGDPVTAADFVYAWRRVVTPETAAGYRDLMYFVKNARAIAAGQAKPESLGVEAPDERTLVVTLERPAPYFPQIVCLNPYFPVHRATVEKHGREWTKPENIVGNGPFLLAEARPQDRHVFVRNPKWREAAAVKLEKFVWLTGSNIATGFNLYETGACHWTFQAPLDRMDQLRGRADHLEGPYNTSYFYVLNTSVKPLDDARVRKALRLAIDRGRICSQILRGGETPADRLTPMLVPGYEVR